MSLFRSKSKQSLHVHPPMYFIPKSARLAKRKKLVPKVTVTMIALLTLMFAGGTSILSITLWQIFSPSSMQAAARVMVETPLTIDSETLALGPDERFTNNELFSVVSDAYEESGVPHLIIDLEKEFISYKTGEEQLLFAPIKAIPPESSWRSVPAGLYEVEILAEEQYSALQQMYYPYTIHFSGNYRLHGVPYTVRQEQSLPTEAEGIRLNTSDAEILFKALAIGTPVLVHAAPLTKQYSMYVPSGPTMPGRKYLIADIDNSNLLAGAGVDDVVAIASLTKLMTALVAVESLDFESQVSVSPERYVTTLIPRLSGHYTATMHDLMKLLLIESSNEAAEVIAAQLGRDTFIAKMNTRAIELGLTNTIFSDPSGLDDGNQSTAYDLFLLTQYIYDMHPYLLSLTMDQPITTAYTEADFAQLENFNLLKDIDTLIGGKVGETMAAGQTSVTLHQLTVGEDMRTMAIILLQSDGREDDVTRLHAYLESLLQVD